MTMKFRALALAALLAGMAFPAAVRAQAVTYAAIPNCTSGALQFNSTTLTFSCGPGGGSGTVASVGLTMPSGLFSVSGSPVTGTGVLAASFASQTANTFLAAPNGSAGVPTMRAIVTADLPTIGVAGGGTGLTAGTSGGILGFTATGTLASSGLLTANAIVLGGGAAATPSVLGSLGTTSTVLHGNASGAPSFGAVNLGTDVTSTLPAANMLALATGDVYQGNGSNQPAAVTLSAALDAALGSTQGNVLYRGASTWTVLAPGSNGTFLESQGSAANPVWGTPAGAGSVSSVAASGGTTGLTFSGSPITTSGTLTLGGTLAVASGGTGLGNGTSGGIIGFTATGTIASSGALTANALILGGGAGVLPSALGSLGTTTTLLHGNASGAPTFGAVVLTTDVSGILPVPNGGSGAGSFTAHGVLLGEGTAAHGVTGVGTSAQLLVGQASADPSWQTMSGDATIGATGVIAVAKVGGDANVAFTDTKQTFTAAQRGTVNALTFGSTITPSFDVANNFSVTLTGAATLANPSTTPVPGQAGQFTVTQDSTGGRTLAFGTLYKFPGGSAPTLSTGAGAVDILSYYVVSATQIAVSTGLNFQ